MRWDSKIDMIRLLAVTLAMQAAFPAWSLVLINHSDPDRNTSPPVGELAGSGWDLQGLWNGFVGTPIDSRHFITANHIGGRVGEAFILHGRSYFALESFTDPKSDLAIWTVDREMPAFARLNDRGGEVGRSLVVFGRGRIRGEEVRVKSLIQSELKGWNWGAGDGRLRWGENRVEAILSGNEARSLVGGRELEADLLRMNFDRSSNLEYECHLMGGDSGGGIFIQTDGVWKLAGINVSVSGPYNLTDEGPGFEAAIFDEGGLYTGGEGNWNLVADRLWDMPGSFFATRIASRLDWIESILAQPVPEPSVPVVLSAPWVSGPYSEVEEAEWDPEMRLFRLPISVENKFFKIMDGQRWKIIPNPVSPGKLELRLQPPK